MTKNKSDADEFYTVRLENGELAEVPYWVMNGTEQTVYDTKVRKRTWPSEFKTNNEIADEFRRKRTQADAVAKLAEPELESKKVKVIPQPKQAKLGPTFQDRKFYRFGTVWNKAVIDGKVKDEAKLQAQAKELGLTFINIPFKELVQAVGAELLRVQPTLMTPQSHD